MYDLLCEINDLVETQLSKNYTITRAENIGLDRRASMVYVSEQGIVVYNRYRQALEYYGGFEYVDKDYVITVGEYTFYAVEDNRVADAVQFYFDTISESA